MYTYIARRLILTVFILFSLSIILFVSMHAIPGDIVDIMLGVEATPESVAALKPRQKRTKRTARASAEATPARRRRKPVYAAAASLVLGVAVTAVLLTGALDFGHDTAIKPSAPVAAAKPNAAERDRARQQEIYRQAVSRAQVEVVEEAESEFSRLLSDWRQKLENELPLAHSDESAADDSAPAQHNR